VRCVLYSTRAVLKTQEHPCVCPMSERRVLTDMSSSPGDQDTAESLRNGVIASLRKSSQLASVSRSGYADYVGVIESAPDRGPALREDVRLLPRQVVRILPSCLRPTS
jgi:hypothetical protein